MKRLIVVASMGLAMLAGVATTSCAAILPALPPIMAVITDALAVMQIIDSAVQEFFRSQPAIGPEVRAKYTELYQKALAALMTAQHALEGVEKVDQQEYDRAFAEFKEAYLQLLELLNREGLMQGQYLSVRAEGSSETTQVYVPEPQALKYQVR